ncbi:MAG: arginase family protein [Nanoarchaeota archaeon]|nr:arginase family protein [Nanoarchaeota archaeon]
MRIFTEKEVTLPECDEQGFSPFIEVSKILDFNSGKIVIIGDNHKESIKNIAQFSKTFRNCGLIMLDAHPDCKDASDIIPSLVDQDIIDKNNILIAGIRSWKKQELEYLKNNRIKHYTMREIAVNGLHETSETLMTVARTFGALYISIDLDVLDPAFANTSAPEPGGFTTRELITLIQRLKRLVNFKAADIMETQKEDKLAGKLAIEFY